MLRNNRFEPLWQDRDIRFDASSSELHLRPGERIIETFGKVEDTKGNTGEVGKFTVTDLRVIWQSLNKPRINLSIGIVLKTLVFIYLLILLLLYYTMGNIMMKLN